MSDDARTDAITGDGWAVWKAGGVVHVNVEDDRDPAGGEYGQFPVEVAEAIGAVVSQDEVDRLRAELDRRRVAGDGVVRQLRRALDGDAIRDADLDDAVRAWLAVRGDAPAAPPATANSALGVAPAAAPTDGQAPADKPRPVRYLSSPCANCEHTYNHHASTGACESCLCRRFRDLPPLNRDRAPAPPLAPEWTAAPADDTAAPDGPEPDGWITDDDQRIPHWSLTSDVPLRDAVNAWPEGIEIDGDLIDATGAVDAIEVDARKLLAAVAWHRKFAAARPVRDGGEPK